MHRNEVTETFQWLCKQGLAFRGHDESEHSKNRGNFRELIEFQSKYNKQLKEHTNKVVNYLSPQILNEIIEIIAAEIIKTILPNSFSYFATIVDETMDIAKHEQVSI